jgi:hypothetical protein
MALRRSPKPGRLDRTHLQGAAQLVHHQGGQGLALHVLGDDQQGLAHLGHLLQKGQQVLHVADLLLVDQDVGIFQTADHLLASVMK